MMFGWQYVGKRSQKSSIMLKVWKGKGKGYANGFEYASTLRAWRGVCRESLPALAGAKRFGAAARVRRVGPVHGFDDSYEPYHEPHGIRRLIFVELHRGR